MTETALITGGSSNTGRAIGETLLQEGWEVALHYHSSSIPAGQFPHHEVPTLQADLSTPEGCEQLIESYGEHYDNLDLLVNNAALFRADDGEDFDASDWNDQINVNARAPYHLSLGFADRLEDDGAIVNITDTSLDRPYASHGSYFASKAALTNLTRTLAKKLAPDVRVNAVAPGPIDFPDEYTEKEKSTILERTLLNRPGSRDEVAEAVQFLATRATYTTGSILEVDGGKHLTRG